jgi:starch phosphorylase
VAYDTPVVGWGGEQVNTLRLWSARAGEALRLDDFNRGDHVGALSGRMQAEAISRVLYPGDDTPAGQELRLRQEYFFAAASLQDVLRRHLRRFGDLRSLPEGAAVQINDTHPAIGIAELVRLLVDVHGLGWDEAWGIARRVFSYTNHTLLPEALESWPVPLLERLLPRHMQIVYLINAGHLEAVRAAGRADGDALLAAASLIDESHGRRVRMGHLAFVGSHKVNGVSALHTGLMRRTVFRELDGVLPGRIVNKTNGVTFRRWLHRANPRLTALLVEALGERVLREPEALEELAPHADDAGFRDRFRAQRRRPSGARGPHRRAARGGGRSGRAVRRAGQAGARVQAPAPERAAHGRAARRHPGAADARPGAGGEGLRRQGGGGLPPGQAGHQAGARRGARRQRRPGGARAAEGGVPAGLQRQPRRGHHPGRRPVRADLHRGHGGVGHGQHEAGAERRADHRHAGRRHRGDPRARRRGERLHLRADRRGGAGAAPGRRPDARALVDASPALSQALEAVAGGVFSPDEPERYRGLVGSLLEDDHFMVLADFEAYCGAQRAAAALWAEPDAWWRAAVLNTARVGWFSSDRAVREYAEGIWGVPTRPLA